MIWIYGVIGFVLAIVMFVYMEITGDGLRSELNKRNFQNDGYRRDFILRVILFYMILIVAWPLMCLWFLYNIFDMLRDYNGS